MIKIYAESYVHTKEVKAYPIQHEKGLLLLQQGLKEIYQLDLDGTKLLNMLKREEHGKPFLEKYPEIHFNISHCKGMVVCVFSDTPVGADIEKIRDFNKAIVKKILTKEEELFLNNYKTDEKMYQEMFFRFWTLKESYLKWDGRGFFFHPKDVSFRISIPMGEDRKQADVICSDEKVEVFQYSKQEDMILSICKTYKN